MGIKDHKPTFLHGKVWLLWRFYIHIYSTKKYSLLGWCYKYIHARHKQPPLKPLHSMTLDTTTWSPRDDLYVPMASFIYNNNNNNIAITNLKSEFKSASSNWSKNTQRSNELSEKVKFLNYFSIYIKKKCIQGWQIERWLKV